MVASVRLLSFRVLDRHLIISHLNPHSHLSFPPRNPNNCRSISYPTAAWFRSAAFNYGDGIHRRPASFFRHSPLFLSSVSCSDLLTTNPIDGAVVPEPEKGFHHWDPTGERHGSVEKGPIWTVVLLGWLGAEEKHLKRYADIYNAKGIPSVRFVVPIWEMLGLDFGRMMEAKVARFAAELADWCSQTERDGRERHLLFHTFSNTGWLV